MQQGKNKKKYMKEPILFPVCREVPGTEGGVIPQEGFVTQLLCLTPCNFD